MLSCTTNMEWEESWLWTVSWPLIPALPLPNCIALGYSLDPQVSPLLARTAVPVSWRLGREFASVMAQVGVNSFSFLCQLTSLPGEGEECFGNSRLILVSREEYSTSPPIPSLWTRLSAVTISYCPFLGCLGQQERRPRERAFGLLQLSGSCHPLGCLHLFFPPFKNKNILLHNHSTINKFRKHNIDTILPSTIQSPVALIMS